MTPIFLKDRKCTVHFINCHIRYLNVNNDKNTKLSIKSYVT